MVVTSIARILAARGLHYGWIMVGLVFFYGVCASAAMSVPGVLLPAISKDLGWSIGEMSGPLGLRVTLFGLIAPFAGGLVLLYGPRRMLGCAAGLVIVGIAVAMTMTAQWQMWLSLGILLGVAPGLTAGALGSTVAMRWFTDRRGLAIGLLNAGSATGQLILLAPAAWIAETYGWRAALMPFVVLIGGFAVLFMVFGRDRPADVGLPPLGERTIVPPPQPPQGNVFSVSFDGLRLGMRSRVFWVLAFAFFVCGISSFGLMPHFVTLCGDFGIPAITSTALLAAIGVFDLIGTIGSGWLSDRYDNRWLLFWYYFLRGLALMWLPFSGFSLVGLGFFAVFYGLDFIATVPPTVRLAGREFGREMAPVVFGWMLASHQVGAGIMAFATGASRDALATYLPAFFIAGLVCIPAAFSLALLRKGAGPIVPSPKPA